MIIEQVAPDGPTAWLAAVGLATLTRAPLDPVDAAILDLDGEELPSAQSRWVKVSGAWELDIDGTPPDFPAIQDWFAARFGAAPDDGPAGIGPIAGRDPWWRMRGNASVTGIGRALYDALLRVDRPVDLAAELRGGAGIARTDSAAGWVIDRQWVTLEPDQQRMGRPLVRYALAFIGASVAQWWPGHMVGGRAVGHLWDGQPGDHPLTEHVAITWEPIQDESGHYPPWWGRGEYVVIPAASWATQVRERWSGAWLRAELLTRTDANRVVGGRLPAPHLVRGGVPLWRRSLLQAQAAGGL